MISYKFEPICNIPFNNARECLFRSRFNFRFCLNDLDMFKECKKDPVGYAKFREAGTFTQNSTKHYFGEINKGDIWE